MSTAITGAAVVASGVLAAGVALVGGIPDNDAEWASMRFRAFRLVLSVGFVAAGPGAAQPASDADPIFGFAAGGDRWRRKARVRRDRDCRLRPRLAALCPDRGRPVWLLCAPEGVPRAL